MRRQLGLAIGAVLLAGCGNSNDPNIGGVYDGATTLTLQCSGSMSAYQDANDETDLSQSGSTATASLVGENCTVTGSVSGNTATVTGGQCPTMAVTANSGDALSVQLSPTSGSLVLDGCELVQTIGGSASVADTTAMTTETCQFTLTGTLADSLSCGCNPALCSY